VTNARLISEQATRYRSTTRQRQPGSWAKQRVVMQLQGLQDCSLRFIEATEAQGGEPITTVIGNGDQQYTVVVWHQHFWSWILWGGTTGAGESYAAGHWECDNLLGLLRALSRELPNLENINSPWSAAKQWLRRFMHARQKNSRSGSRKNIAAHYDLGNDLFEAMLDPLHQYSSAVFTPENSGNELDQAQKDKCRLIGERLDLQPGMRLLEVGCGWGGLACYLAQNYGVEVDAITISQEQFEGATERVRTLKLEDQVRIHLRDYRDLEGTWDRVVSIEMIEAVGHQFYQTYFNCLRQHVKNDGLILLQAILMPEDRYGASKNRVDFIKACIFPGCCIPSVNALSTAAGDANLQMVAYHDHTPDYAKTLAIWWERCQAWSNKPARLTDEFWRMWEFYLKYCEAGFAERLIQAGMVTYAAPNWRATSQQRLGYAANHIASNSVSS
jgi:cyclopropane-fatty-acyl-phospholipid synthase